MSNLNPPPGPGGTTGGDHGFPYAQVLDQAREPVFGIRPEGTFFYVNSAACTALGYPRAELLNLRVADVDPVFPFAEWPAHWEEVRRSGGMTLRTVHRHKEGREFPVEVTTRIFRVEDAERMFAFVRDLSAQQAAETAARTAGALLEAVLDSPKGVIVFSLDRAYRYTTFTNSHRETMRAIWGVDIAPGMDMLEAIRSDEDRTRARANFDRALTGEHFVLEEEYGDAALQRSYWENRYGPVRDAAGEIIGLTVFVTDISERRRTELALAESEGRYRTLFDSMTDAFASVDLEGRISSFNAAFQQLVGRPAEAIRKLTYRDLTPERWHAAEARILREQVLVRGWSDSYEKEYIRGDGRIVPVELKTFLVRDGAGRPTSMSAIIRDISGRRAMETALQESEARHRALFETMAQGVVYQDAAGRIIDVNPAAERILGLTRDQLMGRTSVDPRWRTVHANGAAFPGEEHPAMAALRTGRPVTDVIMGIFHPGEGRHRWALVNAVPEFRADESRPYRVYATLTDITEQKRIQDELAAAERKLHTVVSNSQAVIYQLDAEGRFLLSEGMGLVGLGLRPGQVVGQSALQLYGEHPQILRQLHAALGGSLVRELTEVGGMAFDHFLTPVRGADGRVESVIGIATDVTAQRQAEAALRASESRLRTVTDNTPDTILMVDQDGRIRFVNRLAPGLAEADVLGAHVTHFVPEDQQEMVRRYLDEAFVQARGNTYESWGPGPGGLTRYYSVRVQPVLLDGKAVSAVYTATDITEAKAAQDRLRASEARYRALYEQTPVMLHSIDREGRLVNVSDLWLLRMGYHREDVVGRPTTDFLTEGSARFAREQVLPEFFRTGACSNVPYQFVTRTGEVMDVLLSATAERDADGAVASSLAVLIDVTEQKRALDALRRSEAKFGALFAAMGEGVALHELVRDGEGRPVDYRILEVNPAYEANLGIPAERAVSSLASQLYHVEPPPFLAFYAEVAETGHGRTFETFFAPLDKHLRVSAVALDRDHFATVFQDISEQVRGLEALRKSEASYRGLFDGVHEAIYIQDRQGRFLDVNRGALEMYGHPREAFIGHTPEFLSAPGRNDLAQVVACVERAFAGEPQSFEFWGLRRNGEEFPKEVRLYPGTYFGQEVVVALSIDISERRRAEAALRESEARFRALYEHTPDTMFWIRVEPDGDFIIEDINPSEERLLGLARTGLVGKRIGDVLPAEPTAAILRHFQDCVEARRPQQYEERAQLPSGTFTFMTQLLPILDGEGRVRRIIGTSRDITEQRNIEEALRRSQKLESLGVLAGGIAHDFNNLLTAMLGNLNLAQMHMPEAAPAQSYLDAVERTLLKASDLTKQMLAYSGKGRFVIKPQDLNAIVREMLNLLQVSISKMAELKITLQDGLPSILAEAAQVQQVVMNLVTNASEALGDGPGVIRVATALERLEATDLQRHFPDQAMEPGPFVVLEVADSGCGIPAEVLARIFDPFFTTKTSGRGLGLSALLGILRGHRGGIRIHSEPGRGSRFSVYFPAETSAAAAAEAPEARSATALTGLVLLVDDEDMILQSTGMALESLGLEVVMARDGAEGVERFLELGPRLSLVLMDLSMPRMDGVSAFLAMHAAHPEVPVLLSSGYDPQEPKEDLIGKGLAGFIQKPYRIRDLAKVVAEAISGRAT